MATVDPNAVAELTAMGITEEDAVACLKACNGNPNTAAEYYWNGDLDKARQSIKWDESLWQNEDPSGGGHSFNNNYVPQTSFTIHSNDVYNHPPLSIDPKSRPPSRANSTSAQVDDGEYSNRNAVQNWAADVYQPYGSADDPELAQALAASMGQETGTTTALNTSPVNPNFARAPEGKTYDPSQWALATTTATREVDVTPTAEERRRVEGAPAFLKPARTGGNLAGALTVFACIPKAREALLALDLVADDYGSDDNWWNGERIQEPRSLSEDRTAKITRQQRDLLKELQRLMSFLDGTTRSYASIEVLTKLIEPLYQELLKSDDPSKTTSFSTPISTFFRVWRSTTAALLTPLPPALAIFDAFAREQTPEDDATAGQHFQVLELRTLPDLPTLDSLLHQLLWSDDENPVLLDTGDVLTIQVFASEGKPGVEIDIPENLYPDRYTAEWNAVCKPLKEEMRKQREKIVEQEVLAEKLSGFARRHDTDPNAKTYSPRQLLELTISHFETPLQKQTEEDVDMDAPRLPDPTPVLKDLLRKLEAKLQSLTASQQEAQRTLLSLTAKFTTPDHDLPEGKTLTQYSLRGVVINSDTTYVQDTSNQWWKFIWIRPLPTNTWDDAPAPHPEITRSTIDEAIRNARYESETVLLVYAKAEMLAHPVAPLPASLVEFVRRDNEHFAAELAGPKMPEDVGMDITEAQGGPEKKRRLSGAWLDDDSEAALRDDRMSPKRNSPFSCSSATLGGKSGGAGEGEIVLPTLEEVRSAQEGRGGGDVEMRWGSDAVMEDVEERKGG